MRVWPLARGGYESKATKFRDALVEAASSAPARASLLLPRRVNAARGMLGAKETAMLDKSYPYYIAGKAIAANPDLEVLDKYYGKRATRVAFADTAAVRTALTAAAKAAPAMAAFPHDARRAVLEHCVARFTERHEELARDRTSVVWGKSVSVR